MAKDDQVLIVRRPPHEQGAGFWEFPGGKIDPGETPEQALIREIDEELGIQIKIDEDLGVYLHAYETTDVNLRVFICHQTGGQLVLREHDGIKWLKPQEIDPQILLPADRPFIQRLQSSIWARSS